MTNSSTPPLLQPPPYDLTNHSAVKQWMQNTYSYITQNKPAHVLLSVNPYTALTSVSLPLIFNAPYTSYTIQISNVHNNNGGSGGYPVFQFYYLSGGVATLDTGGNYLYQLTESTGSTVSAYNGVSQAVMQLSAQLVTNGASALFGGSYTVSNPLSAYAPLQVTGNATLSTSSTVAYSDVLAGHYNGSNPVCGINFFLTSNDSMSGTFKVFGNY